MKIEQSLGVASDADIENFEREFNVVLPEDFKMFLKKYNGAAVDGEYTERYFITKYKPKKLMLIFLELTQVLKMLIWVAG